ncbi:hypothetical protein K525DRAFT_196718 [Schizophyllum commune Loenen D]|nr:hypothetical protein K525DRAFT_196718 [Schizophyllum commune Loenen D]
MLSINSFVVSTLTLTGLAVAFDEGQDLRVVSFFPKSKTFGCGFPVQNDGSAAFLPAAVFDQVNCNKIKASNPSGNGETIEPVLAGIHESADASSGDATLYLTPDAFVKLVGGGVPHSPKDVKVVRNYE